MRTCKYCGSVEAESEHLATGDWYVRFACGTWLDDNGDEVRGQHCLNRVRDQKASRKTHPRSSREGE